MPGELDFMEDYFTAAGVEGADEDTTTQSGNETTSASTGTEQESSKQEQSGQDSTSGTTDGKPQQGQAEEGTNAVNTQQQQSDLPAGALKLRDGTIVNAGQERRWFDQMNLTRDRLRVTQSDLNTANQKLQNLQTKYDAVVETVKQVGLEDPQHMQVAVSLFRDLQADPVGTVTKLLAEMKAKGHNLDGIAGGVDTRAIQAILDRKLGTSEQQRGPSQEEIDREIESEVQSFIKDFPDALTHEVYIARVVEAEAAQGRQISLRDAYFALRERVTEQGLDWTQPLGPQLQARQSTNGQQQQQQQSQQQQQQSAPRPTGRVTIEEASAEIDPAKVIAPRSESTEDIVRAAMQEAGYFKN